MQRNPGVAIDLVAWMLTKPLIACRLHSPSSLSGGKIAGIVIGCIAGFVLALAIISMIGTPLLLTESLKAPFPSSQ